MVGVFDVEGGVHGSCELVVCYVLGLMNGETIAEDVGLGGNFEDLGLVVLGIRGRHAVFVFASADFLGVEPVHKDGDCAECVSMPLIE